jgi:hypothetical protein
MRIHLFTAADRRTGERESETLVGFAIADAADRFWLNAHPSPRHLDL